MGLSLKDNDLSLRKWRDEQKIDQEVCSGMHVLFRPPSACRTAFTAPERSVWEEHLLRACIFSQDGGGETQRETRSEKVRERVRSKSSLSSLLHSSWFGTQTHGKSFMCKT